mmetsp:Transcript_23545/g.20897  ORF Transcript_23545/g.20897 Transcript_23545/m.20897 type:complete len:216 (-) Transcript_23545:7-654(-)
MMDQNQHTRLSAAECLEHEWFKVAQELENSEQNDGLDVQVVKNIKDYKAGSLLRKKAINILVKFLTSKEIKNLKELFEKIDTDHSGYIEAEELAEAMRKVDEDLTQEDIDGIIKEIDVEGNQKINYSEFIAATLDVKATLTDAKLITLFKNFDLDNSGYITLENLQGAFKKFGNNVSKSELQIVLDKHDIAKDGKISYEEFQHMIFEEHAAETEE